MATPAEVLEHFSDVRSGSAIGRARAAAKAFRSLASLGAEDKRRLAILVAERAAPELVPRIEAETGLDLTREQVQAVIDMAGRLDEDDLDDLRHVMADPDAREQALRGVATTAATAAATATGMDDVVTEPPPPGGPEPPPLEEPEPPEAEESAPSVEDAVDEDTVDEDAPEDGYEEELLDDLGVESEPVQLEPEPEPQYQAPPAPEPREFVSIFDTLPDPDPFRPAHEGPAPTTESAPVRGTDAATSSEPAPPVHDVPDLEAPDTIDLTDRVRATRAPLVEQLRRHANDAGRLRLLRSHLASLREMDDLGRAAVVDAIPDGWARRRALDLMLRTGILSASEVPDLVARLQSPVNRAWIVATAIEAGVFDLDDLDLLDERAASRLRTRYA